MEAVLTLVEDYGTAVYALLFLYCALKMRTIGALPVGLTPLSWPRFTLLNAASALVWATLLVGAGYLFGETIENAVGRGWGVASVLLLLVFAGAVRVAWRRIG